MSELKTTLKWITISAIFLIPFIVFIVPANMFFPFITGKNFTFRILVEIMVASWAILAYMDVRYRPKFSYILAAATTFLGILAVADMLGENPYRSFWSNYERMEGLITHAHLFLYFVVAGAVMQTEALWTWFFRTSMGVSLLVCWHAFSQIAGSAEIHQSADRVDASLGNSTYLAVYNLFNIFLAIYFFFRDKGAKSVRWVYLVVPAVNLVSLYYTQTRGAIVGLIAGAFLTMLLIALFDRDEKGAAKYRKHALGALIAIVALVGAFWLARDSEFVRSSNTLARLANMSITETTVQSRFLIWNMSWEGFKERPILGWGQDNFVYVFAKHFDPRMWAQEPWFDRSHNVFFDWLMAGGILGLLAYLSLFGSLVWLTWFSKKHTLTILERSIFTGMLAAYFVQNLFVFDNLTSYLVFFSLLAYIHALHTAGDGKVQHGKDAHNGPTPEGVAAVAITTLVIFVFVLYTANIKNISANKGLIEGIRNPVSRALDGTIDVAMKKVIDNGGFGNAEAREQLGQIALQALDPKVDQTVRDTLFKVAREEIQKEVARDPNNLRTQFFMGSFYERFRMYDEALTVLTHAVEMSPKRQLTRIQLGILNLNRGDLNGARDQFKTAWELDERYGEAQIFYVISLLALGDNPEADKIADQLKDADRYDNRLILAYARSKRFDVVEKLLMEKLASPSADGQTYITLAGAYNEGGKRAQAIATLKAGIEKFPDIKNQASQMIAELEKAK